MARKRRRRKRYHQAGTALSRLDIVAVTGLIRNIDEQASNQFRVSRKAAETKTESTTFRYPRLPTGIAVALMALNGASNIPALAGRCCWPCPPLSVKSGTT